MEMLSKSEWSSLKQHEKTIETTKEGFIACGNALGAIQEGKLYRAEFDTFEEYCKEKWGWSRIRAYQLIEAAQLSDSLPENVKHVLQNSRQAAALAKVPKKDRKKVLKEAAKDGDLTAAKITEVAAEILEPKSSRKDRNGKQIPDELIPLWNRGDEVQAMVSALGKIKGAVNKAQEDEDLLYRSVNFSATLTYLENAQRSLKNAIPYAICWTCQGRNPKKCAGVCKGTGLVSKFAYDSFCPKEIKAMLCKT